MTTYGDNQEPGIITDLTSSAAVSTAGAAPSDVGLVGQADLDNAVSPADTSKVYEVTRASKAVEWFGPKDSSLLTQAVIDALSEGAFPVYAVAAPETAVAAEDISGATSTTYDLANAPIREEASSVTVTLDGSTLNTNVVYDDVSGYSPNSGECYVNPVRATIQLPALPGDGDTANDTVAYEHFDYMAAMDVMVDKVADTIDFLVPLSEHSSVVDYAKTQVGNMETAHNLALALGGAGIHVDPANFTQGYDDSRTQTIYPTRFEDNTSALGAYAGFRASLGLGQTPINKRLTNSKRLAKTVERPARGTLGDKNVVALADEATSVRVTDDPTTVSDTNTDEQNLQYGFNRLVADYIISTTRRNQKPFIGKLNSSTVRNTMEGMIDQQLTELQQSNVVLSYELNVFRKNATTAELEMAVDLVEPLRFIKNTVTIE
jgi:hypothetical protein